jgi:hypothetical protein
VGIFSPATSFAKDLWTRWFCHTLAATDDANLNKLRAAFDSPFQEDRHRRVLLMAPSYQPLTRTPEWMKQPSRSADRLFWRISICTPPSAFIVNCSCPRTPRRSASIPSRCRPSSYSPSNDTMSGPTAPRSNSPSPRSPGR